MFRLLGFIIGSAVSILTILLITGIPEFHLSNPDIDKRRFEEALEKLREKSQGARLVAADTAGQMTASVANEAEPSAMERLPEQHSVDADLVADATAAESVAVPLEDTAPVRVNDTQWHAFWNPFRSRIAAQGFVARLEEVTGLDYRIEKVDVGVYEVAFAYADDTERTWKLSQISAATGLELPES
jgi:hypothetical protein